MKGIPAFIQTPEDMRNLAGLAQQGKLPKAELAERIRGLLAKQYHQVPIIAQSGKTVTVRYFPEAEVGSTTIEGLKATKVEHIEAAPDEAMPSEGVTYGKTIVTFSATPAITSKTLVVYMADNFLTENGFDVNEINNILGGLE